MTSLSPQMGALLFAFGQRIFAQASHVARWKLLCFLFVIVRIVVQLSAATSSTPKCAVSVSWRAPAIYTPKRAVSVS